MPSTWYANAVVGDRRDKKANCQPTWSRTWWGPEKRMRETNARHPSFLSKLTLKLLEALIQGELMKMLPGTLHHQTGTRVADGRRLRQQRVPFKCINFQSLADSLCSCRNGQESKKVKYKKKRRSTHGIMNQHIRERICLSHYKPVWEIFLSVLTPRY